MTTEYYKNYPNLVKTIINSCHGKIGSIVIDDFNNTRGTGLCNSSLLNIDGKIYINVRHVEYTLFVCEKYKSVYEGCLSYYHRDDDMNLRTNNYLCELDTDTLQINNFKRIDMSLDVKPIWHFIGLEDARMVRWDDTTYLVGVRRDTTTNGQGRMEFSEIVDGKEMSRIRIEPPDETSYCEKNWMPIMDKPYHFVKWTNPLEVVKVDLSKKKAQTIHLGNKNPNYKWDLRGGTPLINWFDDTYMCIIHECYFQPKDINGNKSAIYKHRVMLINRSDYTIKKITRPFDFMTGAIEFCIGLAEFGDDIIISFGFYDNGCYAIKCSKNNFNDLINGQLSVDSVCE